MDPYAPPTSDVAGPRAPREKSGAWTASIVLAVLGLAAFWTPIVWLVSRGGGDSIEEVSVTFGLLLAMVFNLMGVVAGVAAPQGRRLLPILANLITPVLIVALVF